MYIIGIHCHSIAIPSSKGSSVGCNQFEEVRAHFHIEEDERHGCPQRKCRCKQRDVLGEMKIQRHKLMSNIATTLTGLKAMSHSGKGIKIVTKVVPTNP